MDRVSRDDPSIHRENAPVRENRPPHREIDSGPKPELSSPQPTAAFRVTVNAQLVEADKLK
jgi:hypothetical protein